MTQTVLAHVLQDIKTLEPEELHSVERAIQELREAAVYGYSLQEYKAMQSLVEAGLMKEIKPRPKGPFVQYTPVPIQGKPLSETIIEERR